MKKHIYSILVAAFAAFALGSCSDVDIPAAVQSAKVSNLAATVEGRAITLNWTLPSAEGIKGVNIYRNNDLIAELGAVATYTAKKQPANQDLLYTVKIVYENGNISEGETFKVDALPGSKVAMLLPSNNDSDLDDDELAAKKWFVQTYGDNGTVFTPATLTSLNPSLYAALWIQIDRVGLEMGPDKLPADIIASGVVDNLSAYLKTGGNVFLTKHATQLISSLGRIAEQYGPHLFGSGEGGEGTDIWTTNAVIGSNCDPKYDHRSHAAFAGLEVLPANDPVNGYDHDSFPLEGPGFREDHNCMWDLNSYGFTPADGVNVVDAFEKKTSSVVLATWGHVTDYCCGGIIEFLPTADIKGRVLCIGLSAYEFNQNSVTNQYQQNTEKLTKNCIDYLAAESEF